MLTIFQVSQMLKKISGKKIILTSLMFLNFILLSYNNVADAKNKKIYSFDQIENLIKIADVQYLSYNSKKTSAIVYVNYESTLYINFTRKELYLIDFKGTGLVATWLDNNTVQLTGSCGIACATSLLFIAPKITITCPEYYPDDTDYDETEKTLPFRTNHPLLIDVKKQIYICYDAQKATQVFPFPKNFTIRPPND